MHVSCIDWSHRQGNYYLNEQLSWNHKYFWALVTNNEFEFNIDHVAYETMLIYVYDGIGAMVFCKHIENAKK